METQRIQIGNTLLRIQSYYQKLQSMPDDVPGSVCFGTQLENAQVVVLLFPISADATMPFDMPQAVINGIHQSLEETQGLIEVNSLETANGGKVIYSIIKNAKQPSGVQYFMRLHYLLGNDAVEINAFFDECGMTGNRDALIFSALREKDIVKLTDNGVEGWTRDPYDAGYTEGFLMNLSEQAQFDEFFPTHPLSDARRMVKTIVESN